MECTAAAIAGHGVESANRWHTIGLAPGAAARMASWYSPSYSPRTDLLYVATRESGSIYFLGEAEYKEGEQFNRGGFRSIPDEEEYGAIRALHPATGAVAWEYNLFTPPWAGVLSTAVNLVFRATNEGQAFALQASTRKPLWRYRAGGMARAIPVSYTSDGK